MSTAEDNLPIAVSKAAHPGDPPCIINLRAEGFRAAGMRRRFRDSRQRGRRVWGLHPAVYRSYVNWSIIGSLLLAGAGAFLARGVGLLGAVLCSLASAAWAGFWIWVISYHLGLVQTIDRPRVTLGLPNALTFLRILLVPAICWAILAHAHLQDHASIALALIFLVGFTDVLDGLLARLMDLKTPFGRYLDHLSDVLIMCAAAIAEYLAGILPGWLTALVVFRYMGTGIGGIVSLMMLPGTQIRPTWMGKVVTFVVGMTVFLALARTMGRWPLALALPWIFALSGVLLGINIGILACRLLHRCGRILFCVSA